MGHIDKGNLWDTYYNSRYDIWRDHHKEDGKKGGFCRGCRADYCKMEKKYGLTRAVRSWKRASTVFTHENMKDTKYVVASSQAEEYRKTGVNVWECT